jgi:hypothetical protein
MKTMIKLFTGTNLDIVENNVNEWLMSIDKNHNRIIEIKFSSTIDTFDVLIHLETGI